MMRFKLWRSTQTDDGLIHIVCMEGEKAFDALPRCVRRLGPWQGSVEGEIEQLKPHYRLLLKEQGFYLVHGRINDTRLLIRI
jgi:hypothetical protein